MADEKQKSFDAEPLLRKTRDYIGAQVQSSLMLQIDYESMLQENENLKLEIEKKDKLIKAYEDKEKVKNTAEK